MVTKVDKLNEPAVVGNFYFVKAAYCKLYLDEDAIWIPIMGKKHIDQNLNIKYEHYHVDGRFFNKALKRIFGTEDDNSGGFKVINTKHIVKIKYIKRKCLHSIIDSTIHRFNVDEGFLNFSKKFQKKNLKMKNFICPHRGFDLKNIEIIDGTVICPMHCLKFNVVTGEQIIRKNRS